MPKFFFVASPSCLPLAAVEVIWYTTAGFPTLNVWPDSWMLLFTDPTDMKYTESASCQESATEALDLISRVFKTGQRISQRIALCASGLGCSAPQLTDPATARVAANNLCQ